MSKRKILWDFEIQIDHQYNRKLALVQALLYMCVDGMYQTILLVVK